MKLAIDERVKHRLIGLAVILSIGAIFAPAIMKKSNQRIEGNVNVSVELPPKPAQPDVAVLDKNSMFESAKVAHVELPEVSEEQQALPAFAKAEPLSQQGGANPRTVEPVDEQILAQDRDAPHLDAENFAREDQALMKDKTPPASAVNSASLAAVHKVAQAESFLPKPKAKALVKNSKTAKPITNAKPKLSMAKPKPIAKPSIKKISKNVVKGRYGVQLAMFTRQRNADSLISKLKVKGYSATYKKVKTTDGMVYKVIVGQLQKREQAQLLQKKLASAVQIRGFIVSTDQG